MKKIQLFLVMLLLSCLTAAAQSVTATGKVTYADDGSPVIGATIKVKGSNSGATVTDVNGVYKITIPAGAQKAIEATFLGLKTATVDVPQNGTYNISMEADATAIEEVIVTGYGNVSKKEFTGSAATVKADRVKDIPSVSVESRLAGATPGVQLTANSGQPGAAESIRIRGMGSINAGNNPLYVVDGVPVLSGNSNNIEAGTSSGTGGSSILSTLNPNDIESMTVIKDAAAASLYGSRAANGVIVITTKKGRQGKTQFNVKANVGFSDMAVNFRPTLDGDARRELLYMGLSNYAQLNGVPDVPEANQWADGQIDKFAKKPWSGWTDWKKELMRVGVTDNYEVSASGGNDKTRFFSSLSYVNQEGLTRNSNYQRITGRVNLTHTTGILTFEASSLFSSTNQRYESEGSSYSNPIAGYSRFLAPSDYPYNEDGTFNTTVGFKGANGPMSNPLNSMEYNVNTNDMIRSLSTVSANLRLFKGFNFKQLLSYDYLNTDGYAWWDPRTSDGGNGRDGVLQRFNDKYGKMVSQTQVMYDNTFGKHTISALLSFETESYKQRQIYASGMGYPGYQLPEIDNAATPGAGSNINETTMMSVVSRLSYNYDSRYYISGSYRRDGTSRLAPESRWGDFWSVSGSWRLSQEKFWKNGGINGVLTDAKIRASYGVNGTQPSSWYGYMGVFGYGRNYNGIPGSAETRIPNPNLRWEQNQSLNIGLDFTFKDRFSFVMEYYNRDTKDLIMDKPISQTTGFARTLENVGSMNNRGFEFQFTSVNMKNEDFDWTTSVNFSYNKNKLTGLVGDQQEIQELPWLHRIGESYYTFYAREYAGVDPATGGELYYVNKEIKDAQGNVTGIDRSTTTDYTKVERVICGQAEPVITGGLVNNFSWRNIDFGFTLTFSLGGNAYDDSGAVQSNGAISSYNGAVPAFNDINKMWQKPGDNAELPRFVYNSAAVGSDRWIFSTDHLRLKNVTLGYTLPKRWTNTLRLTKIRVYGSASNLLTWKDKRLYLDPEAPIGGIYNWDTPPLRTVTFGIEIGF